MKKSKSHIVIALVFTVIPAVALSVLYVSRLTNEPYNYMISYPAMFIALASITSLIIILRYDIDYVKTYKRTLLTDVMLFLGVMAMSTVMSIFGRGLVSVSVAVVYPIICVFVIAKKVYLTFEEHSKSDIDNPKLSHILVITFINPLLPFLPFLMSFFYAIATMKGLGIK